MSVTVEKDANMIFAKAVTQNPRRKATPKDVENGTLNVDGEPCKLKDDVYVFPEAFARAVPQITEEKDVPKLFTLTPDTELPYPDKEGTAGKAKLTTPPSKEWFVDIINKGLVAYYSGLLLKFANDEKTKVIGKKKKGRGAADLTATKLV